MERKINKAYEYISTTSFIKPEVGVILGSGLGNYAEYIDSAQFISYSDVPGMPVSTVMGHKSHFVLGTVHGVPAIFMQGRFHCYEGYEPAEVVIPIRVMSLLGVKTLLVTNAAGGIHDDWEPGVLMNITDHINFAGYNPLRGPNLDWFGPRFPDMSQAYDLELQAVLEKSAQQSDIALKKGVYAMMPGPNFETPAEIRMLKTMGADAVGMSTVPEVIAARHCDMRVAGVSCITNYAAGISKSLLSHEEVFETATRVEKQFSQLLNGFFEGLSK
ncbi:purine-nucleoside phosphorylase [Clostridia bacterium OttesenSCG-928-F22]|nr:purine-nucleoside phosphorylase [Clostridia bacterium OttesenSCG-928-F22]